MTIGIQHVQISVEPDQLEAARAFYVEILGAVPMADAFPQSGGFWLRVGQSEIHVRKEKEIDRRRTNAHTAYLVEDLAAVRAKLEQNGFEIFPQPKIEGFDRFHTYDPSGNRVEVMQRI